MVLHFHLLIELVLLEPLRPLEPLLLLFLFEPPFLLHLIKLILLGRRGLLGCLVFDHGLLLIDLLLDHLQPHGLLVLHIPLGFGCRCQVRLVFVLFEEGMAQLAELVSVVTDIVDADHLVE